MIETESNDGVLPSEPEARLITRIRKYGALVEMHVFLVELRPGYFEIVLRDFRVTEGTYSGAYTIPLPTLTPLLAALRTIRSPKRRHGGIV